MKANKLLGLALWSAVAASAQTGTITGNIVTVSGGNPVPQAPIHAKNTASGASFSTESAANGSYAMTSLPPGAYELSAEFPPLFVPFRQQNIQVHAGHTVNADIHLCGTK